MATDRDKYLSNQTVTGTTSSEVTRRKAALIVCEHATDLKDAGTLLNMLGLDNDSPVRGLGAGGSWG